MNEMGQILMRDHYLENETLSLKAKGLFSLMLDKMKEVPDWNFTIRNLAELNKDGIEAVGNAVRELEQAGYVERHRTYSPEGHISGVRYILHRIPLTENPVQDNHKTEK